MRSTCQRKVPMFAWVPTRRSAEGVLGDPEASFFDFVGNEWAHHFAKKGARTYMFAQALEKIHKMSLAEFVKDARILSWMTRTVARRVDDLQPRVDLPEPRRAPPPMTPVVFENHDFRVCDRPSVGVPLSIVQPTGSRTQTAAVSTVGSVSSGRRHVFRLTPEDYRHPTGAVAVALEAARELEPAGAAGREVRVRSITSSACRALAEQWSLSVPRWRRSTPTTPDETRRVRRRSEAFLCSAPPRHVPGSI
ncbi:unnamed protein product [Prorocentrum cordatum]|uniref:Uncharacterized protein n=1 Tax=Prorocentrum cordatum TaxID=2364126 RepID=A0ABN9RU79_9DINO|nr:unnamed protein product [Polarella glacialis]